MNMNKNQPLDYSNKANWYQIPEITKDVDTFYVYVLFQQHQGQRGETRRRL